MFLWAKGGKKKVLILLIVQVVHSIFCRNASAFGLTWTRASLVKKSTPKKMSKNIGGHTFFGHFEGENGFPKSLADVFLEACVYPICPC